MSREPQLASVKMLTGPTMPSLGELPSTQHQQLPTSRHSVGKPRSGTAPFHGHRDQGAKLTRNTLAETNIQAEEYGEYSLFACGRPTH